MGSGSARTDLTFSKVGIADLAIHFKGRFPRNTSRHPVGSSARCFPVYLPVDKWAAAMRKQFIAEDNVTIHPADRCLTKSGVAAAFSHRHQRRCASSACWIDHVHRSRSTQSHLDEMMNTFCYPADHRQSLLDSGLWHGSVAAAWHPASYGIGASLGGCRNASSVRRSTVTPMDRQREGLSAGRDLTIKHPAKSRSVTLGAGGGRYRSVGDSAR